jgi:DNA-binding transcriptional regulator YdaS (Cro superfamily)
MTDQPNGPLPAQAKLLDFLIGHLAVKNDAALAVKLGLTSPVLSKLRNGRIALSAGLLLRIHDASTVPLADLRALSRVDAE